MISADYFLDLRTGWLGFAKRNQPIVPREAAHLAGGFGRSRRPCAPDRERAAAAGQPRGSLGFHTLRRERHDAE